MFPQLKVQYPELKDTQEQMMTVQDSLNIFRVRSAVMRTDIQAGGRAGIPDIVRIIPDHGGRNSRK